MDTTTTKGHTMTRSCDFEYDRSKCGRFAAIDTVDTYGAPRRFCDLHWQVRYRRAVIAQHGRVR